MIRIRHKIILILLVVVLLPLIPISVLVYNLVNQSYQIGVNPQVQQALEQGVNSAWGLLREVENDLSKRVQRIVQKKLREEYKRSTCTRKVPV